jgi:hypothetical protein
MEDLPPQRHQTAPERRNGAVQYINIAVEKRHQRAAQEPPQTRKFFWKIYGKF